MGDGCRTPLDLSLAVLEGRLTGPGGPFELRPGPSGSPRYASGPQSLMDVYRRARRGGDKPLFARGGDRRSYSEIFEPAFAAAGGLRAGGWAGRRIALCLDDGAEWLIWFVAITASGASCVLTSPSASDDELVRCCSVSACDAFVARPARQLSALRIPNLYDAAPSALGDLDDAEIAPDSEALVTFTSGSSGTPKGVVHSHRSLIGGLRNMMLGGALANHMLPAAAAAPERPQAPSTLVLSPFSYIAGYSAFLLSIATGGRIVLPVDNAEHTLLATVETEGVQTLSGAPSDLLRRLIRGEGAEALRSLRRLQLHGSAMQRSLVDELYRVLPAVQLFTGYGSSETSGSIATASVNRIIDTPGGCGRLLPSVELRVVDDAGDVLGAGAQGHLQIRGDMLMSGYLDEMATAQALTADGWFRTGDVALIDDQGWLEVAGRSSDRILGRVGLMAPIEDAVRSACGVEDAAIHPSSDGRALVLYLQAAATQSVDQASAVAALKLASGWTGMVDIRRLEVFPRTASGKIDRLKLDA